MLYVLYDFFIEISISCDLEIFKYCQPFTELSLSLQKSQTVLHVPCSPFPILLWHFSFPVHDFWDSLQDNLKEYGWGWIPMSQFSNLIPHSAFRVILSIPCFPCSVPCPLFPQTSTTTTTSFMLSLLLLKMAAKKGLPHRSDHSYDDRDDLFFDSDNERDTADIVDNSDEGKLILRFWNLFLFVLYLRVSWCASLNFSLVLYFIGLD